MSIFSHTTQIGLDERLFACTASGGIKHAAAAQPEIPGNRQHGCSSIAGDDPRPSIQRPIRERDSFYGLRCDELCGD